MRRPDWLRRLPGSWRFTFVSVSLVGTTVLATVAAYLLHASLREHERSVDRMLHEYARYTSRVYGEATMRWGLGLRLHALAVPLAIRVRGGGDALTLEQFEAHAAPVLRYHDRLDDPWLGLFRLDVASGEMRGTRSARRPEVEAAVRVAVDSRTTGSGERGASLGMDRLNVLGEPLTLFYAAQRTLDGEPVAVLGIVTSRRHAAAAYHRQVMRELPLQPPSMISPRTPYSGSLANDSLASFAYLDQNGVVLFESPHPYRSSVTGEFRFNTGGPFAIRATLSPLVVEQIRASYRSDPRRRWAAILLPLVSLTLGASAIVHLQRERELVKARRDFVASVSHELRTPLAQIQLFAETLLRGRERSEEERRRWLGVVSREAYRMGGLVENILMFSHLERVELHLAPEPTALGDLVRDVLDTFEPLVATHEARVVAEIPPELKVDADPRAVRQVLGNLLDNALKYGPSGQTIRIAVVPAGPDRVGVAVCDQGPGVPAEARDAVWLPFRRISREGGSAGGSGLGLAVVRALVAQHGGATLVDDAPGGGARFVITLPRVATPPPAAVEGPAAGAATV